MPASLSQVYQDLKVRHFKSSEAGMGPLCTRVTLRTGVSIKTPRPDQDRDQALVAKVVAALADLGYPL